MGKWIKLRISGTSNCAAASPTGSTAEGSQGEREIIWSMNLLWSPGVCTRISVLLITENTWISYDEQLLLDFSTMYYK